MVKFLSNQRDEKKYIIIDWKIFVIDVFQDRFDDDIGYLLDMVQTIQSSSPKMKRKHKYRQINIMEKLYN